MTQIGEGSPISPEPNIQQYKQQVDQSSVKFLNALNVYKRTDNWSQKQQFKAIMDQQLALIRSAVSEMKQGGIYNQEIKVEHDYRDYMSTGSYDSLNALEQDMHTLRDYNQVQ